MNVNQTNPYAPSSEFLPEAGGPRKVRVRVFQLFQRTWELIGDQYWLFLGIVFVGFLIGSAVPFGLIMGPVLVGLYLCYIQKEQTGKTEFATMFKGFENFLDPFLAFLIVLAVGFAVMLPFMIGMFALILIPAIQAANAGGAPAPPPAFPIVGFLVLYPLMIAANILVTLPFLFTFQLIADRNLKAVAAVKLSVEGVLRNFWGMLWCMMVITAVSFIAALMCYFPLFLLMPITLGALFMLYRDVYGPSETILFPEQEPHATDGFTTPDSRGNAPDLHEP